jgi:hypothetical protein
MHYMALLFGREDAPAVEPGTPEFDAELARYAEFEAAAGAAIAGGAVLYPANTAVHVRQRGSGAVVTDGPFVEQAEVANGYYLFAAPDQEAATAIAVQIPLGAKGRLELRRVVDLGS